MDWPGAEVLELRDDQREIDMLPPRERWPRRAIRPLGALFGTLCCATVFGAQFNSSTSIASSIGDAALRDAAFPAAAFVAELPAMTDHGAPAGSRAGPRDFEAAKVQNPFRARREHLSTAAEHAVARLQASWEGPPRPTQMPFRLVGVTQFDDGTALASIATPSLRGETSDLYAATGCEVGPPCEELPYRMRLVAIADDHVLLYNGALSSFEVLFFPSTDPTRAPIDPWMAAQFSPTYQGYDWLGAAEFYTPEEGQLIVGSGPASQPARFPGGS